MVHLFRTYQRPLMIAITIVIIVAFVLLYNVTQLDQIGVDKAYQIYGQTLKQSDVERTARRFPLAQALGLNEMIMGLAGNAISQEQAMENFVWNSYVLTRETKRLGITPSPEEMLTRMKELPGLQTNGQFDPMKYQEFLANVLMPNGFTVAQLEDLVRDELKLRKLMLLIGATTDASPAEFQALYIRGHEKIHASIISFDVANFIAGVEPTDEQIQKYFEANTANLQTEERRVISFAEIVLNEEERKLTGREKMEALSRQSQRAEDFGQELLKEGATFASAAEKLGLKVTTTGEFTISGPAEELSKIPNAAAASFQLTESTRESNPLEVEDGLVVLHLEKIIPAHPLTLEEARPRIVAALKEEQGRNDLTAKANEVRAKLETALAEKKSLTEAAAAAGVSVEKFPVFSQAAPAQQENAQQVAEVASELPVGALSRVVPTASGALLVYVDQRDPVDAAKMAEDQAKQLPSLRQFKRYAVFNDWLSTQLKIANPHSLRPARSNGDAPANENNDG